MTKSINLVGMSYGRLTVISSASPYIVPKSLVKRPRWNCKCECGNLVVVNASAMRRTKNPTKSCGCLQKEAIALVRTTHGMGHSRLYNIYTGMITRCYNTKHNTYKNYGGRGITVCDEWRSDVAAYCTWAKTNGYRDDLTIERIDNDKGYSPDNCKWITSHEQAFNKRVNKNNTSGAIGVSWDTTQNTWKADIMVDGIAIYLGKYKNKKDAAYARNKYITENNLPHRLSDITT